MEPYLNIIEHFGVRNQMKKLNEECFEFLEAVDTYEDEMISHVVDKSGENMLRDHVVEEMGDILTILTQFIGKYDIKKEELDKIMDYKLERTLDRIKSKYYEK